MPSGHSTRQPTAKTKSLGRDNYYDSRHVGCGLIHSSGIAATFGTNVEVAVF
jgi:hypothetical protein